MLWATGDPTLNAQSFLDQCLFCRAKRRNKRLARWAGAAIACATCCEVISSPGPELDAPTRAALLNIQRTVQALQIAGGGANDDEEEDDDEEDEEEEDEEEERGPEPETHALEMIQGMLEVKALGTFAAPAASAAAQSPGVQTRSAEARGSEGAAAAAATTTAGSLPAQAPSSPQPSLPLPSVLLQDILATLDCKSSAAAALACKHFSAANRHNRFYDVPAPLAAFRLTLEALDAEQEGDWGDGSTLPTLCISRPLDGSAACGSDLREASESAHALSVLPTLEAILQQVMGGGRRGGGGARGRRQRQEEAARKARLEVLKAELREKARQSFRPPPHQLSSPLAAFKATKPVPLPSGLGCALSPPSSSCVAAAGPSSSSSAAAPTCFLSAACCDVSAYSASKRTMLHLDGDLLATAFAHGWKQRDPGLEALCVTWGQGGGREDDDWERTEFRHGLYDFATRMCADAGNGLVWAAADDGRRIKAFRPGGYCQPMNPDAAACNRGRPNGHQLQYTLASDVRGVAGRGGTPAWRAHAGLHVLGTRVICVKGSGLVLTWDIADMLAQLAPRPSTKDGASLSGSDDEGEGGSDGDEARSDEFEMDLGWRDACTHQLEASAGVPPALVSALQRPRLGPREQGSLAVGMTRLLLTAGEGPALVAAMSDDSVAVHDLETGRIKRLLLGHAYEVEDIAVAPASWQLPPLFATASRCGDVKLYDVRNRSAAAAVTLTTGATDVMNAVALARAAAPATEAAGPSQLAGSSQLGAGLLCFAGGAGEAVWAWDLRGGQAQALYELSTGNAHVHSLAWHEASNSLLAAVESLQEDRMGCCAEDDFEELWDEDDEAHHAGATEGERLWPKTAKHKAGAFSKHFNLTSSALLRYRFGGDATRKCPDSEMPAWADYDFNNLGQ